MFITFDLEHRLHRYSHIADLRGWDRSDGCFVTWVRGDGRPFNRYRIIFKPLARTIRGALRSEALARIRSSKSVVALPARQYNATRPFTLARAGETMNTWPTLAILVITTTGATCCETLRRLAAHLRQGPARWSSRTTVRTTATAEMLAEYPDAIIISNRRQRPGRERQRRTARRAGPRRLCCSCKDDILRLLTAPDAPAYWSDCAMTRPADLFPGNRRRTARYEGRLEGNYWRVFWR